MQNMFPDIIFWCETKLQGDFSWQRHKNVDQGLWQGPFKVFEKTQILQEVFRYEICAIPGKPQLQHQRDVIYEKELFGTTKFTNKNPHFYETYDSYQ